MFIILCSFLILLSNMVSLLHIGSYFTIMNYRSSTDFLNGDVRRILLLFDRPSYTLILQRLTYESRPEKTGILPMQKCSSAVR